MAKQPRRLVFDPSTEELARALYQDACAGGEHVLKGAGSIEQAMKDENLRREFYRQAHMGFARAQEKIVERLVALEGIKTIKGAPEYIPEEILLRKAADSIAWQMLGRQLYIARRLCSHQPPPKLTTSNYLSVLNVARKMSEPEYSTFALMADVTTFIHIADLAVLDSKKGALSFAEVKEGDKNHRYLDALHFLAKTPCVHFLQQFHQEEGKHGIEQLERMAKQAHRMGQVSDILSKGMGEDPFLNQMVHVPDEPIDVTDWEENLRNVIENSKARGWAIDVIEDVLFLGAYRGDMQKVGPMVFGGWFKNSCDGKSFPVLNIMQCMQSPLALPIFARSIKPEAMFDLLFGRCRVYLGINLDKLMGLVEARGAKARWATRKESAKIPAQGAVMVDNRAIFFEKGDAKVTFGDGLLMRMAFHATNPSSIADVVIRSLEFKA
ncbi:MAG TPA: hypothetical protein VGD97_11130 [Lacunisphaera sp.]